MILGLTEQFWIAVVAGTATVTAGLVGSIAAVVAAKNSREANRAVNHKGADEPTLRQVVLNIDEKINHLTDHFIKHLEDHS